MFLAVLDYQAANAGKELMVFNQKFDDCDHDVKNQTYTNG